MSKNLLSENMLRFGTKNLSERQERELVVKSIMETIDQHGLHGEVRNRLIEQGTTPATPPVAKNTNVPFPKSVKYVQNVDVSTLTGYNSALVTKVSSRKNGDTVEISMWSLPKLQKMMNYNNFSNASDVGVYLMFGAYANMAAPTTRQEVREFLVPANYNQAGNNNSSKFDIPGDTTYHKKNPANVKAGGQYTTNEGKTIKWGRPGTTLKDELTDIVCAVLGIA